MSVGNILWQALVKHALILLLLFFTNSAIQSGVSMMLQSETSAPSRVGLILVVNSVIIAGLLAGYLTFRYASVQVSNQALRRWQLILAHLSTGGMLFVVGTLILVLLASLHAIHQPQAGFGGTPFVLVGILYVTLVCYDLYGLMGLVRVSRESSGATTQ